MNEMVMEELEISLQVNSSAVNIVRELNHQVPSWILLFAIHTRLTFISKLTRGCKVLQSQLISKFLVLCF